MTDPSAPLPVVAESVERTGVARTVTQADLRRRIRVWQILRAGVIDTHGMVHAPRGARVGGVSIGGRYISKALADLLDAEGGEVSAASAERLSFRAGRATRPARPGRAGRPAPGPEPDLRRIGSMSEEEAGDLLDHSMRVVNEMREQLGLPPLRWKEDDEPEVFGYTGLGAQRQRRIDRARPLAESLAEVDELLNNEASAETFESRIRSRVRRGGLSEDQADQVIGAARSGDRSEVWRVIDGIAREHGLQRVTGRAGGVEPYDRRRHDGLGGGDLRGRLVEVIRPGYALSDVEPLPWEDRDAAQPLVFVRATVYEATEEQAAQALADQVAQRRATALARLRLRELRQMARQRGVRGYSRMTRQQLIDLLVGSPPLPEPRRPRT